ncbi:YggS family pyridoxal phosphate-dependent enzyme [Mongoliitalea daihaiensis]|uniref:YggS family pyridoxal phosphate-dependent enzyme n=1 Tax=Mongoliitalea daihaiensis TaxID=2782006 RepID=UPI001F3C1DDD|nr:YggS family pyridoxal phosphate-dependent enzyme [Mongoliitalea daihaiensis]UJP63670.1 YggS family pyridoxal phosphate-dependent enzyme [Mongoliitalea daihaiensis]
MNLKENLISLKNTFANPSCTLVAVSKTKPKEMLMQAYEAGVRDFGENKVQEMSEKAEQLPSDIRWHMIGHLQRNKVKYIAPFVHLIHSVDSLKLLKEIDKEAKKNNRIIQVLLQVYIAQEESKFGLDESELKALLHAPETAKLDSVKIVGLMGMATYTENEAQIRSEFRSLKSIADALKNETLPSNVSLQELSMGMSGDYLIAQEEGSTMIRVGSAIFGERNYQ